MDVTILIVEYHCIWQVSTCIASLRKWLGTLEWECVVVSNSEYTERENNKYRDELACDHYAASPKNLGYAGGVNLGAKYSTAPLLFILNPDSILQDTSVVGMIRWFSELSTTGAAGPKVVDEEGLLQPSCRRFPYPWTFLLTRSFLSKTAAGKRESSRYFMGEFDHQQSCYVDWVSGGAMLIDVKALNAVGGFDERYFLYMEDVDFCKSLYNVGYKVAYYTEASVMHAGQHASIKAGPSAFMTPHVRWHLSSLLKYFMKWGL